MALRVSASFLLLFSVLFLPFWLTTILALFGVICFSYFGEAILFLLLSDLLFGLKEARLFNFIFISAILGAFSLIIVEFFKKKLKFYT